MTPDEHHFDRLMNYLTGRMSESERLAFEGELARNPALQKALDEEKTLRDGVRAFAIRNMFKTIHEDLLKEGEIQPAGTLNQPPSTRNGLPIQATQSTNPPVRPLWAMVRPWQVAAACVGLTGAFLAGIYFWNSPSSTISSLPHQPNTPASIQPLPPSEPPTTAKSSEPPVGHPPKKNDAEPPPSDDSPFTYFQQLTTELTLDRQLAQLPNEELTRGDRESIDVVAEARRLLLNGQAKAAIDALQPLAEKAEDDIWAQTAQWYLAGAFLKEGKLTEGKTWLEQIAQTPEHPQQTAAQRLLKRMNKAGKKKSSGN